MVPFRYLHVNHSRKLKRSLGVKQPRRSLSETQVSCVYQGKGATLTRCFESEDELMALSSCKRALGVEHTININYDTRKSLFDFDSFCKLY